MVDFDSMLNEWVAKGNDPRWAIGKECWEYIERELSEKNDDRRRCFEFGCGLSSVLFRQSWYCCGHSAFENSDKWLRRLIEQYSEYEFPFELMYVPVVNGQWCYGSSMELFEHDHGNLIDVCFIDGPSGTGNREGCIPYIKSMMSNGGLVIVDDVNRPAEFELAGTLALMFDTKAVIHNTTYKRQFAAIHLPE